MKVHRKVGRAFRVLGSLSLLLTIASSRMVFADFSYETGPAIAVTQSELRNTKTSVLRGKETTKAAYRKTAELFLHDVTRLSDDWARRPQPYPNIRDQIENIRWLALAYHLTGEEIYATRAARGLKHFHLLITGPQRNEHQPRFQELSQLYLIEKWLAPSAAYTERHRDWIRAIALRAAPKFPADVVEYGSFNRAFLGALAGESLLLLIPDAPDAAKWREYKERIWNDWWTYRDTTENSDHYNALWFGYLLDWVEMRGAERDFWADAGVKDLFERFLYQVFPMGTIPNFSDGHGWNVSWGYWVHVFEACASNYRDGRYKWAAHRIFEYSVNRIEDIKSWTYTGSTAAWHLLRAYAVADDSVMEVPRDSGVALLNRHRLVQRSLADIKDTRQFFDMLPELIPDKLVFNSGPERDAMSMTIDAVGSAGHGHRMPPALVALADRESLLLMSLGYIERFPEHHNIPQLADYEGYPYDNIQIDLKSEVNRVSSASAEDLGAAGYGHIQVENYLGYPATLVREVVFVKDAGVLLKDTLTTDVALQVRWGPAYRVRNIGPDYGDNWVNTYMGDWINVRGMQVNSSVLTRWKNTARDLLIYFLPESSGSLELIDDSSKDKTLPLPLRVQYALRQNLKAGESVSVVTLLLPHGPGSATQLAGNVRVILNKVDQTVVEFASEDGVTNTIVLNSEKQRVDIAGVSIDTRVACVRHRDGIVLSQGVTDGKRSHGAGKASSEK